MTLDMRRKVPRGSRKETDQVGVAFEEYEVDGRLYERFIAHWQDADGLSRCVHGPGRVTSLLTRR